MIENVAHETLVEIAKSTVTYLRTRLVFTQRLRATYPPEKLITIDKFREQSLALDKRLSEIGDRHDPTFQRLNAQFHSLLSYYNDGFIISESQIDEVLGLVEYSIIHCGINTLAQDYSADSFILSALRRIEDTGAETGEFSQALHYWLDWLRILGKTRVFVSKALANRINIGFDHLIKASNHNYETVFSFAEDGTKTLELKPEDEDFLIADDCFVGDFYRSDEQRSILAVFLKKTIAGEEFGKAVSYDNIVRPMYRIKRVSSLHEYLRYHGMGDLCKNFYHKDYCSNADEISLIVRAINHLSKTDCANITELAAKAADWWTAVATTSTSDDVDIGDFDTDKSLSLVMSLYKDSFAEVPTPQILENFRSVLARKVRAKLMMHGWCELSVDYDPCRELGEAAAEANMSVSFPFKTFMQINMYSINVHGDKIDSETIFKIN
ncbi:MAG: hypothetical protein ABF497_08095 [Sporolactobacillus sp.]